MKTNQQPLPFLDATKIQPMLSKISLLGGLSEAQSKTVIRELRTLSFKKGDVIFKQNELPTYIYIVLSGQVRIFSQYQDTLLELLVIEPGQCFGETALIGIQPHSVSAAALSDCELIILTREALLTLFENDKELYSMLILNIARETSRHLHSSNEHFIEYAMTHQQSTS